MREAFFYFLSPFALLALFVSAGMIVVGFAGPGWYHALIPGGLFLAALSIAVLVKYNEIDQELTRQEIMTTASKVRHWR